MAKRHGLAGAVRSSRRNARVGAIGKACVEALEGRVLLAVTILPERFEGSLPLDNGWSVIGNGSLAGRIEGDKFNDLDGDGVRDAGEPGLAGWTIYLDSDNDGVLDAGEPTQITDASGHYAFSGLLPGSYSVREVLQSGWGQTYPGSMVQRLFEVRTEGTAATIYELDPTTGAAINSFAAPAAIAASGPQGLALGSNSLFYIDSSTTGPCMLWELNPDTGAVIDSDIVDLASPPFPAGLGYLNGKVYIENVSQIVVWDPVSDTAVTTLNVAADLTGGLTGAADRGVLYDSNFAGQILKIDPATGGILATFSPGGGSLYGGLAYVNGELIASDWTTSGLVYRINPDTGAVLGALTLGGTGYISGLAGDGASAGMRAGSNLIVNGGFETGSFSGWTLQNSGLGSFVINNGSYDPASPGGPMSPYSGANSALSDQTGPGTNAIYQDIAIPAGRTAVTLSWVDRIRNHAGWFADPNQEYRVEIRDTSDMVLATVFSTNPGDPVMSDWIARSADLSAFAGQTVRVAFVVQDDIFYLNVDIDEVAVLTGGSNGAHTVVLASGQTVTGLDFGNAQSGEICGTKFNDLDGDGVRDAGEPGLAGWTIYLDSDNDGVLDAGEPTQITDASGHYAFSGLLPGSYSVREVLQSGWGQTYPGSMVQRLFEVRTEGTAATIYELDPTTGAAINSFAAPAAIAASGPQGLALGSNSLFYIDSSTTGPCMLWELNPDTGAVIDSDIVDLASPPFPAGLGYLNGKVYIENVSQIVVWDPVSDTAVTTLNVAADLTGGLTGAADRGVLYDSNFAGQILKIDPATGGILATFSPGGGSLYGGLAYVNGELIASDWTTSGLVYRINPDTGAVLGALTLGGTGYISGLAGDGASAGMRAGSNLIVNGGFETGSFSGWTTNMPVNPFVPWTVSLAGAGFLVRTAPPEGLYDAWNGFDGGGPIEFTMYQDVAIPGGTSAVLTWQDRALWNVNGQPRKLQVQVRDPVSNSILGTVYSFATTGINGDTGWQSHSVDLSLYAGLNARICFQENIPESFTGPGQIEFDDISLVAASTSGAHTVVLAAGQLVTGRDFGNQQSAAPTDITLSSSTAAENLPAGTVVAAVSTTDPNVGDTFTYSLATGTGAVDNASFTISGNQLLTAASFNFEARNSYSIRVRTTDRGGLWFEKVFTITVLDAAEVVPTITGINNDSGISSSDGITSDKTLVINGTSEPGMSISVYQDGVFTAMVTADASGNWLFDYSVVSLADGHYSFTATASDTLGHTTAASAAYGVTVDSAAPKITAVYVRGSSWNANYLAFLAASLSGCSAIYGFGIPVGSGAAQLQTLSWRNLNRISIVFSEDVSIIQAQFAIVGSVGSYSVSGFSYNSSDHVATWSLSSVVGADKLYVAVAGSGATPVTDAAGNILDGEWTNPASYSQVGSTSTFPSGDGTGGGDFAFRFDVLPGDSTGGSLGKVNVADIAQTKSRSSMPETTSSYRSDFDGNGLINVADIAYVKSKSSISSLPVDPPLLPTFGPVFSQVSLLTLLREGARKLW